MHHFTLDFIIKIYNDNIILYEMQIIMNEHFSKYMRSGPKATIIFSNHSEITLRFQCVYILDY